MRGSSTKPRQKFQVRNQEKKKQFKKKPQEQTSGLEELWKEISDTEQSLNDIAEHQSQINDVQLEINKKAEQQALAKYGLEFVTNTYLPEKLKEMNIG